MELDRLKTIRLHGFSKLIHTLVMIVTYPLRHIFKTLFVLFVAIVIIIAVPLIKGVPFGSIADWYLLRYDETKSVLSQEADKADNMQQINDRMAVSAPKIIRKQPQGIEPTPSTERKAFKVADGEQAPKKQYKIMKLKKAPTMDRSAPEYVPSGFKASSEILPLEEQPAEIEVSSKALTEPVGVEPQTKEYYKKIDSLPLTYEEQPQEVKGKTFVFSASEISVGDDYLILYGIYTDPAKYDVNKAHQYLKDLVDGKNLRCMIVAYTYNNIATGVCFLNGISVNQNMVDAGFADNIAL